MATGSPSTLDEIWLQMIVDAGGVAPTDCTLQSLMLAYGLAAAGQPTVTTGVNGTFNAPANTSVIVTGGSGTTTVVLPTSPKRVGTWVRVTNDNVGTNGGCIVHTGGSDTFEGVVASTILGNPGYSGLYAWNGTSWTILYTDPTTVRWVSSIAPIGTSFPTNTNLPQSSWTTPLARNATKVNLQGPHSWLWTINSGAGNGFVPQLNCPTWSAGSVSMYEIDLFVSKYDGSQKLWLQHFPSDENPLTSGAVLVPGTGLDLLNTWTVLQSVGSDLSTSLNSGLTVDSTAGGQFMASWYVNIQILSRLIP